MPKVKFIFIFLINIICVFSINAQESILSLNYYGVWDRSNAFDISIDSDYSYLKGLKADFDWKDIQPTDSNNYDWSALQNILLKADNNNQMIAISIGVGPDSPTWIYSNGVPSVITDDTQHTNWQQYPYYYDEDYKRFYFKLITQLGVFLRSQPTTVFENIGWVQVKTGCTGDEVAYKGNPLNVLYNSNNTMWKSFRLEAFNKFKTTFNLGDSSTYLPLLFNNIDPIDQPDEWQWVLSNISYGFGIKGGALARGHHLTEEENYKNTFTQYLLNPQGLKLFSAAEMDQSWTKPLYQINVPLGFYWGAINGLNSGLSVWDVTESALSEAQNRPELHSIFKFFNKYANQIYPNTSNSAFVIFHEGLNSADTVKFPENIYGNASKGNQSRYLAICNAYSNKGAQMDDIYAATQGQVYQRDSQTGYNDAGWKIEGGNYEKWITQINADSTSIGLFRINGQINSQSSIYDRFARSFENSTEKNSMYFKFDEQMFTNSDPDSLIFKITWLDKIQNSTWSLKYLNALGQKTAVNVTGIGDNLWKTISVTIKDAIINQSGIMGSDFMLINTDSIDDVFHGIEVDLTRKQLTSNIREIGNNFNYNLFPNPTKSLFFWDKNINTDQIKVYNSTGIVVMTRNNYENKNYLNLEELENGLYFIELMKNQDRIIIDKIIKE